MEREHSLKTLVKKFNRALQKRKYLTFQVCASPCPLQVEQLQERKLYISQIPLFVSNETRMSRRM
jgi:hypothetical protein